jgi:penicillin-binding protein 1A
VPAQIWHNFMTSALGVDHSRGPALPIDIRRRDDQDPRLKSPLPPEWSNATKPLRDLAKQLEDIIGGR